MTPINICGLSVPIYNNVMPLGVCLLEALGREYRRAGRNSEIEAVTAFFLGDSLDKLLLAILHSTV